MDLRKEAEARVRSRSKSSSVSPVRVSQTISTRSIYNFDPLPTLADSGKNETVKAAKLAEVDYKWNGPRSRIPSGMSERLKLFTLIVFE
jgi:hypothetical protein